MRRFTEPESLLRLAALGFLAGMLLTSCKPNTPEDQPISTTVHDQGDGIEQADPSTNAGALTEQPFTADIKTNLRFETANDTGLEFSHVAGRSPEKFMPETMGGGVIIADFNRDAAPDVFFVGSGQFLGPTEIQPATHRMFLSQSAGKFIDRTSEWGIKGAGYGMGATAGDFDNDGWADVYLTTYDGKDRLLRNTGSSFVDVTDRAKLSGDGAWSTSAGFFDMDHDGDLDLYVVKYVDYSLTAAIPCFAHGYQIYCTPVMFEAAADRLFRNNGNGTFTDVSKSAGIPTDGKGLALAIGDVDRDGDSDIYVANDTTANYLLINDGTGKFEEQARLLGVGHSSFGKEEAGMGADFCDVNNDGLVDIVCTNFQSETTSVYVQQPRGHFIERSDGLGVGQTARRRLSFGVDFFDADNDGDEDLLMASGHVDNDVAKYQTGVGFGQPNTIYERVESGFVDVSASAGDAFQTMLPSRGLATGDLDRDGDLDFLIVNNHAEAEIALNVTRDLGNFVSLWLEGKNCNRSAIGAVVTARIGERLVTRELQGASSYLSACDQRVHLGLGAAEQVDELVIRWPGGTKQSVRELAGGAHYHLIEGHDPVLVRAGERIIEP